MCKGAQVYKFLFNVRHFKSKSVSVTELDAVTPQHMVVNCLNMQQVGYDHDY